MLLKPSHLHYVISSQNPSIFRLSFSDVIYELPKLRILLNSRFSCTYATTFNSGNYGDNRFVVTGQIGGRHKDTAVITLFDAQTSDVTESEITSSALVKQVFVFVFWSGLLSLGKMQLRDVKVKWADGRHGKPPPIHQNLHWIGRGEMFYLTNFDREGGLTPPVKFT